LPTPSADPHAKLKQEAAEYAVQFVQSGMIVGLGTGSTAIFATRRIGELLRDGSLTGITGFPTSQATGEEAHRLGIPLIDPSDLARIDLTIDGADEVDPQFNLIKGGGGALFREKIVAQASAREIIIVDDSKLSACLGINHTLPVEVSPFGWHSQLHYLESLGARTAIRKNPDGSQFVTDSGNMILDCDFENHG
jgi:ribose 5-phosphate isomerase A